MHPKKWHLFLDKFLCAFCYSYMLFFVKSICIYIFEHLICAHSSWFFFAKSICIHIFEHLICAHSSWFFFAKSICIHIFEHLICAHSCWLLVFLERGSMWFCMLETPSTYFRKSTDRPEPNSSWEPSSAMSLTMLFWAFVPFLIAISLFFFVSHSGGKSGISKKTDGVKVIISYIFKDILCLYNWYR